MRRSILVAALCGFLIATRGSAETVDSPDCSTILPAPSLPEGMRGLAPEDLVRIRDIGATEAQYFPERAVTLSPDGHWAAFQLRQADPKNNRYCMAMVIFDLSGRIPPRIVDVGGDPLLYTFELRGIAEYPLGMVKIITPRWSADGKWIAFLKRTGGTTQVWRAFADGSDSRPITHSRLDVADFRNAPDGVSIVYSTLSGIEEQRKRNEKEALTGWHYDERFNPMLATSPLLLAPVERRIEVLDPVPGTERAPRRDEAALFELQDDEDTTGPAKTLVISSRNSWGFAPVGALRATLRNGRVASCDARECEGATHPWWMPDKAHVRFFRREGWAQASIAIYEWTPDSGSVRRLYVTDDVLSSCTPSKETLICLASSSLEPGRLIRLDPVTGRRETLFDPNPEFAHLRLGKPIRLHWRNAFGIETVGDLVLPVGYRSGEHYPMIVVQYDTRGFLRGGTGDEYPIQAFANRGYAILSFKRPEPISELRDGRGIDEINRINLRNFADRRSVESSLERGVRIAVARGIADPKRIGITGLSDGTSTVEWALIHSSTFSAAAVSSCCWDSAFQAHLGPGGARHFKAEGWPGVLARNDPFWKQVALLDNARRISVPILAQTSDAELASAILAYAGLREAGVPIDMFVYPGEFHIRWQPAHRLATYRRSLDWFDFWLRGIRSNAPDRQSELKEWDRLKKEGGHGRPI